MACIPARPTLLSGKEVVVQEDESYVEVRFSDSGSFEEVQAPLLLLEPLGFLEEESSWSCYFGKIAWDERTGSELKELLAERFPGLAYTVHGFVKENWNQEWEDSIVPIEVSDRFVIAPSWNPAEKSVGKHVLIIDPKMSFGTGYHETTRLMLRLMEQIAFDGAHVLDVGTGTGVLAIASMKLGAATATGVDIDEWSYDNAMENAERNGAADGMTFVHGSIDAVKGPFEIILSNITKNDNMLMFDPFHSLLTSDGTLIVSGFHTQDNDDVAAAAKRSGFTVEQSMAEQEWSALRFLRTT